MADPQYPQANPSSDDARLENAAGPSTQRALGDFVQGHDVQGVAADLLSLAGAGELTRPAMLERIDGLDPKASHALEEIILDAVLFVIERLLADHQISPAEQAALHRVKRALGVTEGALYSRRAARLTDILDGEIRRLLADRAIDPMEALHQVELQGGVRSGL
jgi:hypothetical protein